MGKIKEFFKPTRWKIILTIILTLIIVYSITTGGRLCPAVIVMCDEGQQVYTHPFVPGSCPSCWTTYETIQSFIGLLTIFLIVSYLISCLIIFIYNKIKIKQKQNNNL